MSQWGALGRAAAGQSWEQILSAYYASSATSGPPLTFGVASPSDARLEPAGRVTVRLTKVDNWVTSVVSFDGRAMWAGAPSERFSALVSRKVPGAAMFEVWGRRSPVCPARSGVVDSASGWELLGAAPAVANVPSVRFAVGDPVTVPDAGGSVLSGVSGLLGVCGLDGSVRFYRGDVYAVVGAAGEVRTVNDVPLEDYLRGVVPLEMSASWASVASGRGVQALAAQAVAARSYVLSQGGVARRYPYAKTCDSTACQAYGGVAVLVPGRALVRVEDVRSDAAVVATAGVVLRSASGAVVASEYSASNGGMSAGGVFAAVDDPFDAWPSNGLHRWSRTVQAGQFGARLGVPGQVVGVQVVSDPGLVARGFSGPWAVRFEVQSTVGVFFVSAAKVRSVFGWPSTAFDRVQVS